MTTALLKWLWNTQISGIDEYVSPAHGCDAIVNGWRVSMPVFTRALRFAASIFLSAVFTCTVAYADNYPSRPVKIIVPFPAGGPSDFTARLLADRLGSSLKQAFVVENRPGASGNIGTDAIAKAEPDGYTLLLVLDNPLTVHPTLYPKLAFDPRRDFAAISTVASFSLTLVVHPSVPVASVAQFVAYAKNLKDRPLLYGSGGGRGDPGHLTMEFFRLQAGFEAVHVPYKGNAEVVMGLVGGQIQAGFLATPGVLQVAREGRLKALAVSSLRRTPLAPGNSYDRRERVPKIRSWLLPGAAGAQRGSRTNPRPARTRNAAGFAIPGSAGTASCTSPGTDWKLGRRGSDPADICRRPLARRHQDIQHQAGLTDA
jgi:tripartite-type tricarboxylate transporter receptor subunit TctC